MNIKVIIVWLFAIVIVGGIGVFGYVNQDLLVDQGKEVYTPSTGNKDAVNYFCSKTTDAYDSTYTFELNKETNQITNVLITYNSKVTNLEAHTAATNITGYDINGVRPTLNGTVGSFMFMVNVNTTNFDQTMLDTLSPEFQKLGMLISNEPDFNTYVSALNNSTTGEHYTCQ